MTPSHQQIQQGHPHWQIPDSWHQIQTIDMHTGGEPLRVILEGFPPPDGRNVLAYRRYLRDEHDHLRKALMHEPRGHADMYGCVLLPPNDPGGDFGIVFLHNEGYSTMCGHAIIAIVKLAVERKWVEVKEPETVLHIDAPCGRIKAFASVANGRVGKVRFHCVPSFVLHQQARLNVPDLGEVVFDIAYGGAFYAYVDAPSLELELSTQNYSQIMSAGRRIKQAIIDSSLPIVHPLEPEMSFLYGTIFIGPPLQHPVDSRNVCVFADGEVDRCPTGSGVSGRMALHHAKGEIGLGEEMTIESITGSLFMGSVVELSSCGDHQAVIPQVSGTAYVTGQHTFLIDPDDPFKEGFFLR
ncbi:MAG: proline racemase family protein [Bacteroidota bacterium]